MNLWRVAASNRTLARRLHIIIEVFTASGEDLTARQRTPSDRRLRSNTMASERALAQPPVDSPFANYN